jgi:hypothetical protein
MSTDLTEFLQIKEKFLAFLNDARNLYKYRPYYIKDINDSNEKETEYQLLLFISIIKTEAGKCRCHDNTGYESSIEHSTILESQKLLKIIKPSIISEINKILNFEKNNTYKKNISLCGSIYTIKFDLVSDINEDNIYPTILQNLFEIRYLKQLNKLPIEYNLQKTIDYLDCFRLYKYVSIND